MVVRRRRRWYRTRRVLLAIAMPFVLLAFILSLPILLPFVACAQARSARRKAALVDRWPCGWCVAPLGVAALARADALFAAWWTEADREDDGLFRRRVERDLHACCPRCDAGHRYDETANRFDLLDARLFARTYRDLPRDAVPPAMATLAWPWCPPQTATHIVRLARDGDASHDGSVTVPADADIVAIGEALLRSSWLGRAGGDATWRCAAGPAVLVFGSCAGLPFVRRIGGQAMAGDIAAVTVLYEGARDPGEVRPALAGG